MKPAVHPETGEIDWRALRARIANAFDASAAALKPSGERAREILEQRARRLARPSTGKTQVAATADFLSFSLGHELYGLETGFVREVIRLANVTIVPGVPDFVLGVVNVRGDIIPVFDLTRFFGLSPPVAQGRSRAIVLGNLAAEFGIAADSVLSVLPLASEAFQLDAKFEVARGGEWIRGITRDAMIALDGATLLRDERLFIDSSSQIG